LQPDIAPTNNPVAKIPKIVFFIAYTSIV
jgi:hypothetical protein